MKKFLKNIVKLKKISTIKDFRFGLHFLPTTEHKWQKKKDKRTNNDQQNTTQNITDRATRTPLKTIYA